MKEDYQTKIFSPEEIDILIKYFDSVSVPQIRLKISEGHIKIENLKRYIHDQLTTVRLFRSHPEYRFCILRLYILKKYIQNEHSRDDFDQFERSLYWEMKIKDPNLKFFYRKRLTL